MLKRHLLYIFTTVLFVISSAAVVDAQVDTSGVMGYDDMVQALETLEEQGEGKLDVYTLREFGIEDGVSEMGRDLYVAEIGNGDKKVWIQGRIHGNEPYGTNTVIRMIEELLEEKSEMHQMMMEELTMYFIPMYNPDGAERNQRGTILIDPETGEPELDDNGRPISVDLNRDWTENGFRASESLGFYKFWTQIKPDLMLDLHHQGNKYFPESNIPVTMSLGISLAPGGPTLPNIKDGEYDVTTRQIMSTVYDALLPYKEYTVDRYRVGSGGTLEIDIRGGLASAMMLGLNYQGLNEEGHSHPAVFLEISGQFLDGEREPLIEQNMIATRAVLSTFATGEFYNADPDRWYEIPAPELRGYNTDYTGNITLDEPIPAVLAEVSASEIHSIVERYEEIGRFSDSNTAHQLKLHLNALSHYEESGQTDKTAQHIDGLNVLLDHHQNNMTEASYRTLGAYVDHWVERLQVPVTQ